MSGGVVAKRLISLIAKQVGDNGLVVWYNPNGVYADAVKALDLPDVEVLCYQGSFVKLRW